MKCGYWYEFYFLVCGDKIGIIFYFKYVNGYWFVNEMFVICINFMQIWGCDFFKFCFI